MKHFLLCLFTLFSVHIFAQKEVTYTFDFANPKTLTPPITNLGKEAGSEVIVTGWNFMSDDGYVTLSFAVGSQPMGARVVVDSKENNYIPYLGIFRTAQMKLMSTVPLIKFEFSESSTCGDLDMKSSGGHWDYFGHWYAEDGEDDVFELLFENGGTASKIHQIMVTYLVPLDNVIPTSWSPTDEETVSQFDSFVLNFDKEVSIAKDAEFTLSGEGLDSPITLSGKANGKLVTLTAPEAVTKGGVYTITCSQKSIVRGEFYNPELTYNVTVVEPVNSFAYSSIDLEPGKVELIPNGIQLTFPGKVGFVNTKRFELLQEGETEPARFITLSHDNKVVTLNFTANDESDVTVAGTYTITIPEGYIWNFYYDAETEDLGYSEGARCNPEIVLQYIVGDVKIPASEETIAKAKSLEERKGVGYPATTSVSRQALNALFANEEATDAEYEAAMQAFIVETDIELPSTDVYYSIAAISSTGAKAYLKYADGAVTLTGDATEAASFKATANSDGTTTFATTDNKYLHLLINSSVYEGTSTSNVTESYNASVNNITLARLNVEGVDLEQTFGLFSMKGSMGKLSGNERLAYALIGVEDLSVQTNADFGLKFFEENISNAFIIEKQETPEIPIPDAEYELSPKDGDEVTTLAEIILSFNGLEGLTKTAAAKASLTNAKGEIIEATSIQLVEGEKDKFVLSFPNVDTGKYTLTIDKGSFTYQYDGQEASVQAITATYTVKAVDFIYDFTNEYILWNKELQERTGEYVKDTDLNYFTYCTYQTEFGVTDKQVALRNYFTNVLITNAHFVVVPNSWATYGEHRIKLVLDKEIKKGDLLDGQYTYVIEPGTFGDANFAKYLQGDPKITKDMCHVNERLHYTFNVSNSIVTSIEHSPVSIDAEQPVYDLSGRRVLGKPHSGIYVVNGRKVVVK